MGKFVNLVDVYFSQLLHVYYPRKQPTLINERMIKILTVQVIPF
jgi:hypothetical protein